MNQQQKIIYRLAQLVETNKRLRKIILMRIEESENNDELIKIQLRKLDSLMKEPLPGVVDKKRKN